MNNTNEEYVQIAKRALKRACNTKIITISMVTSSNLKNFNTIANKGEMFYNFKMVNYLI